MKRSPGRDKIAIEIALPFRTETESIGSDFKIQSRFPSIPIDEAPTRVH